jgi:DNA (cytosine-5)-methyltransferase 1
LILDLFAGPGGWDLAARALGLDVLGLELDPATCQTRRAAGLATIEADVALADPATFGAVDGLLASPPCQTFSASGKRAGLADLDLVHETARAIAEARPALMRPPADPRSLLVTEPLRWAVALGPRWLAWEQVPAVEGFWRECAQHLRRLGYATWVGVLDAADYGVAQRRRRAVLLAHRDLRPRRPAPTHGPGLAPHLGAADVLGWPRDASYGFPRRNDRPDGHAYRVRDLFPTTEPGPTVTEKARSWTLHRASGPRPVMLAEAAALQGFPPEHPFTGSRTHRFLQVANAVPPPLAAAILAELTLRGEGSEPPDRAANAAA